MPGISSMGNFCFKLKKKGGRTRENLSLLLKKRNLLVQFESTSAAGETATNKKVQNEFKKNLSSLIKRHKEVFDIISRLGQIWQNMGCKEKLVSERDMPLVSQIEGEMFSLILGLKQSTKAMNIL